MPGCTLRHDGRVLIDITRLALRRVRARLPTGVDRVGLAYLQQHAATARAVLVWRGHSAVLRAADTRAAFAWLLGPPAAARSTAGSSALLLARLALWWLRAVHGHAPRGSLLLNTGHLGLEHASYAADLRRAGVHTVFLVHDLIPLTHPEYGACNEDQRHHRRMQHALRLGSGLIVNSRDTLAQLQAYAGRHALAMPPVAVAPLAAGLRAQPAGARPLARPYFVVLGTIEPRKNHLLLLQLWRELVQRLQAAAPHLVVIGRRGWECQETINLLDRSPGLAAHVHQRSHCTDAELGVWLQHAQALLFPSFCEGYGLPAVEALAQGVPVIASDLAVLRESVLDVPDYASPIDGARWLDLISDYARPDSRRRAAQLQRLAGFQPPSWDEHHRLVGQLLSRLAPSANSA